MLLGAPPTVRLRLSTAAGPPGPQTGEFGRKSDG